MPWQLNLPNNMHASVPKLFPNFVHNSQANNNLFSYEAYAYFMHFCVTFYTSFIDRWGP